MKHIRWVLATAINACRAFLLKKLAGHWKSAKAVRKSMKTLLSKVFGDSALKSLKKKTIKKLSIVSPTRPALWGCKQSQRTKDVFNKHYKQRYCNTHFENSCWASQHQHHRCLSLQQPKSVESCGRTSLISIGVVQISTVQTISLAGSRADPLSTPTSLIIALDFNLNVTEL